MLAVLITCHNRRAKTIACLDALFTQARFAGGFRVFLVDDGSTDGTREAVEAQFSNVTILRGNGTLFWCGGMRKAFAAAAPSDPDHYLWLNDDTRLDPDALSH